MRALSLWLVFVLAKVLILAGRDVVWSWWLPVAYLWQDTLVTLQFALLCAATRRRPWVGTSVYALLTLYTGINVPVAHLLSTPLTWALLRATRGTLADSIVYYISLANVLRVTAVMTAAFVLPRLLDRFSDYWSPRVALAALCAASTLVALGPTATAHVDTLGLHRNVLVALISTALPRVQAAEFAGEWRVSPFGSVRCEDLARYRGEASGRNVVMIHLESTGARYLQPYGAARDPMPHLTRLCKQALLFENAYTVYPETIKSFFAVQCSMYPAVDTTPEAYETLPAPGLAAVLAAHGYRTGLFHSGRFMYLGMESVLKGRGYQTLEDAGDIGGERESSFGIDEESTVRRILGWIDALPAGQRFLVSYLPIAGHHPYATPNGGPFSSAHEMSRYLNALHYSDEAVHALLEGLRQRGLDQNTVFVILGDHGEAFGQHEGNHGHTFFLYDENVRVPYVIVAPGLIRDAVRVRRVASLLDTAPTILDLLGLARPEAYQGRSLLDGQSAMALFCTDYALLLLGLRDEQWKLVYEMDSDRARLFDLGVDPDERKDLAEQHPERVAAYREHLRRWAASQKHLILQMQGH